jgi:hypothetical protein
MSDSSWPPKRARNSDARTQGATLIATIWEFATLCLTIHMEEILKINYLFVLYRPM